MNVNQTLALSVAAAAVLLTPSIGGAASLSLVYSGGNDIAADGAVLVRDGDLLTFTVFADFSAPGETTVGGSFDIVYNPDRLVVEDYVTNCGDNDFCGPPVFLGGVIQDPGFGSFNGYTEFEGSVMTFRYVGAGFATQTVLTTAETTSPFSVPFLSAEDLSVLEVDYLGITLRQVPLPAAFWLMLGAIGLGSGLLRRLFGQPGAQVCQDSARCS